MNIFIAGSSTILGAALIEYFFHQGHAVYTYDGSCHHSQHPISRLTERLHSVHIDIAILIAGFPFFLPCLNKSSLQRQLHHSLTQKQLLLDFIQDRTTPPEIILSSSSLQIYDGTTKDPIIETSPLGGTTVALSLKAEEDLLSHGSDYPGRIVHLRLGEVISKTTPPPLQLLPFVHLAPVLFDDASRQVSWVSAQDGVRAVQHIIDDSSLSGEINLTSGDSVSRRDYLASLSLKFQAIRRVKLPEWLLHALCGKDLAGVAAYSARAVPYRLMDAGFLFEDISLPEFLHSA